MAVTSPGGAAAADAGIRVFGVFGVFGSFCEVPTATGGATTALLEAVVAGGAASIATSGVPSGTGGARVAAACETPDATTA